VDWLGERAAATTQKIRRAGGSAIAVNADVSSSSDVRRIVKATLEAFGKLTILLNNAGINQEQRRPLTDIPEEDFDKTLAVDLKGPFLMMKYVVPHRIEAGGGTIVNTASLAAFDHVSTAGYSASKAGLVAMTRVAAAEFGVHAIRVNALCPGATETPLSASQREGMKARVYRERSRSAPRSGWARRRKWPGWRSPGERRFLLYHRATVHR
jgi:NAD(P)-dependent dehydrogenase (short-subunit alcohol dehydrogenase family)